MRDIAQPIYLADYQPPTFLVEQVDLTLRLAPTATRVLSTIRFAPNPDAVPGQDLRLDGEGLTLIAASLDGEALDVTPDATGLTLDAALLPDGPFTWQAEVEIAPEGNTALEGLYMSNGMYCTQCEAEGFRKITFYPDRPDVMAPFRVRVEGDAAGAAVERQPGRPAGPAGPSGTTPTPSPAYLFALVAGDLVATRGPASPPWTGARSRWPSGCAPATKDKTAYALDALKRSMAWDEQVYGRAYDLDIFNIVAVDDFNMGAMENKG